MYAADGQAMIQFSHHQLWTGQIIAHTVRAALQTPTTAPQAVSLKLKGSLLTAELCSG